jgi:hypothetical protein
MLFFALAWLRTILGTVSTGTLGTGIVVNSKYRVTTGIALDSVQCTLGTDNIQSYVQAIAQINAQSKFTRRDAKLEKFETKTKFKKQTTMLSKG